MDGINTSGQKFVVKKLYEVKFVCHVKKMLDLRRYIIPPVEENDKCATYFLPLN